jgi:murein tripeptide amidase MpaA
MTSSAQRRLGLLVPVVAALAALLGGASPAAATTTDFPAGYTGYHTYDETYAAMHATATKFPKLAALHNLGQTYEGRSIYALKISNNVAVDQSQPEVLVECNMHAREHITTEMCLYLIQLLTNNYGKSTAVGLRVSNIVNSREIWIIPMLNPDGSTYDISGGTFHGWRKDRQVVMPGYFGIDPNRNWSYKWNCCGGSSGNPGSARYRGETPFQADEDIVLRDFVQSRRVNNVQQITELLNIHSYGEHVLYPYGYTKAAVPPDMSLDDHNAFVAMAQKMASLNGYRAMQGSQMYIYDGDFIDWAYGVQHIFGFTWEMYPKWGCGCGGFHPPDTVLPRETQRNRAAALYFFEQADCPYSQAGLSTTHCS